MALLKIKSSPYDVVLMDIQMPKMDGYEATKQIRKLKGEKSKLPVIAMTAHVLDGVAKKCEAAGMNDYISKPINLKVLTKIIKKHVAIEDEESDNSDENTIEENNFLLETTYVHLDELLALTNNDFQKIEKYITIFFNNVPKDIELLKEAFDSKEWQELGKTAHKLKGNIGYMGVHSIKEELLILEKLLNLQ